METFCCSLTWESDHLDTYTLPFAKPLKQDLGGRGGFKHTGINVEVSQGEVLLLHLESDEVERSCLLVEENGGSSLRLLFLCEGAVPLPPPGFQVTETAQAPFEKFGETVTVCKKCQNYKPIIAHHCSTCGRCIRKLDHHCPCKLASNLALLFFFSFVGDLSWVTLFVADLSQCRFVP